ncbi:MAG: glycosyltransferase family 2 protein [Phycisphaerales bacterium]
MVPAFNEEGNITALHERLDAVLRECADDHEIIFVDDGSTDGTLAAVRALARRDPRVKFLAFSRNFGHEMASTAGLDRAEGDAVVLIDADLQDPPEVIRDLVAAWRDGVDVAYAQRRHRPGEPAMKRLTAWLFYRLLARLTDVPIPRDTGDFRLMDRRVVLALRQCRENPRFVRGLVAWVGFEQRAVLYDRNERHAGETKYGFRKLFRLSLEALSAFSLAPLRLSVWLGAAAVALSILITLTVVAERLFIGPASRGYALLACGIFFMGGVQLVMLGIIAHYLGQVFTHGQARPLYLIAEQSGWSDPHGREPVPGDGGAREPLLVVRRQTPDHPRAHSPIP